MMYKRSKPLPTYSELKDTKKKKKKKEGLEGGIILACPNDTSSSSTVRWLLILLRSLSSSWPPDHHHNLSLSDELSPSARFPKCTPPGIFFFCFFTRCGGVWREIVMRGDWLRWTLCHGFCLIFFFLFCFAVLSLAPPTTVDTPPLAVKTNKQETEINSKPHPLHTRVPRPLNLGTSNSLSFVGYKSLLRQFGPRLATLSTSAPSYKTATSLPTRQRHDSKRLFFFFFFCALEKAAYKNKD